ncbi:polysaccharide biosynthesis protein [Flavobacterium succinicans]|uniref:Polysaccharide biosynthesis protein n=2 Tax=Flavobacterium succinicans TaxID=29536 RepID=A0A199XT03_9FLAO|nr:polysaccharide biosynthesis protein [Flavobacterium succinicans]
MGVTFVLGFISNKVVAVFLGPSGMAILGNFRNLGAMLKSVATLGISTSLVKLVAENKENKTALSELYATFLSVFIIISSLLAIGVFFFAEGIAELLFDSSQWTTPIRVVGLSLPLVLLTTFWLAIYNGLEQFKTIVLVQLVSSVLVFIVTISLIYFHSIDGAVWAIALSELLMVLATFVFVVKDKRFFQFHFRFLIKKEYLTAIQKFSAMALLTAIIAPLTLLLIRNAITTNYSLVEAGYWEATTKLSGFYMLFFTSGLSLYYMPKLASLSTDDAFKKEVKVYFSSFVPLFLVMLLVLFFAKEWILKWVFTTDFLKLKSVLIWQFIGDFFKILTLAFGYQILVKARFKVYFFLEITFNLSYLLLSLYWIKTRGYEGVIQAYCCASVLGFVLILIVFRKLFLPKS